MPAEVTIRLGPSDRGLRAPTARQLHGMACALFDEGEDDHLAGMKPWSVHAPQLGRRHIDLKLVWADDRSRPALFHEGVPTELRLGPAAHTVLQATGREIRWDSLMGGSWRTATLRFRSPTWFSRSGRVFPLPDPVLVYRSLAARWNSFADTRLPDDAVEDLLAAVQVDDMEGQTYAYDIGKATRVGFVGTASFSVRGEGAARAALKSLTLLAELVGVGAMTTFGAGSVEISEGR